MTLVGPPMVGAVRMVDVAGPSETIVNSNPGQPIFERVRQFLASWRRGSYSTVSGNQRIRTARLFRRLQRRRLAPHILACVPGCDSKTRTTCADPSRSRVAFGLGEQSPGPSSGGTTQPGRPLPPRLDPPIRQCGRRLSDTSDFRRPASAIVKTGIGIPEEAGPCQETSHEGASTACRSPDALK